VVTAGWLKLWQLVVKNHYSVSSCSDVSCFFRTNYLFSVHLEGIL
jgi:hypothetical protein